MIDALLAELRAQRAHVCETLSGLPTEVVCRPVPPTSWAPIAVMHHLALDVERWWFQAVVANQEDAWAYFDANPNGAWNVPDGTEVNSLYAAESALSDAIITDGDLDAVPEPWPSFMGRPQTLFQIVLHVIGETAAHAGQLDIVRESIDGRQHLIMD